MESRKFVDAKIKRSIADHAEQTDQRILALWAAHSATYAAKAMARAAGDADAAEAKTELERLLELGA